MWPKSALKSLLLLSVVAGTGPLGLGAPAPAEPVRDAAGEPDFLDDLPLAWADAFHAALAEQAAGKGVAVYYLGAIGHEAFSLLPASGGWRGPFPGSESGHWDVTGPEQGPDGRDTLLFSFRLLRRGEAGGAGTVHLLVGSERCRVEVADVDARHPLDAKAPALGRGVADYLKTAAETASRIAGRSGGPTTAVADADAGRPAGAMLVGDLPLRWADSFHSALHERGMKRHFGLKYEGALGHEGFSVGAGKGARNARVPNESGHWRVVRGMGRDGWDALFEFRLPTPDERPGPNAVELPVGNGTCRVEVTTAGDSRRVDVPVPALNAGIADFLRAAATEATEAVPPAEGRKAAEHE